MSLDVTLSEVRMTTIYDANITHNLNKTASDPQDRVIQIERDIRFLLVPQQLCMGGRQVEDAEHYTADFRVTYGDGSVRVIDCKPHRGPEHAIHRKMIRFVHGIAIKEV